MELNQFSKEFNIFDRDAFNVFVVDDILNLGKLLKLKIWLDDSYVLFANSMSWHLDNVLIEDLNTKLKYKFPCNRWLSKTKEDQQLTRELLCDKIGLPQVGERTEYEISILTSDIADAGTLHTATIALVGEKNRATKDCVLENSSTNNIFELGRLVKPKIRL